MPLRFYFLAFSMLFICCIAHNQKLYIVRGKIYDSSNNTTLVGANISVLKQPAGTVSDVEGYYEISLPEGKYHLVTSFVGFENDTIAIELDQDITKDIYLKEKLFELNSIIFKGEKSDNVVNSELGTVKLTRKDFSTIPILLGEMDPVKILQLTPGVQSSKEGFTGLYIRGGGADQNLILLDDAITYNPSHLFGFFSVFHPDIVENISLIKAGMPAEYGGRLASVMEINTREGNYEQLKGNTGIGLISSKATIEGPLIKNSASFLLAARRTYVDVLLKPFKNKLANSSNFFSTSDYYFYDLNAKLSFKINKNNRVTIAGYKGNDNYTFMKEQYNFTTDILWGNTLGSLSWYHVFNDNFYLKNSISYTSYKFGFKGKQSKYALFLNTAVRDINYKNKFTWLINNHLLVFGAEYVNHFVTPNEQYAELNKTKVDFSDQNDYYAHESSIYLSDNFDVSRLKVNLGVRYSYYRQVGPFKKYDFDFQNSITDSIEVNKGDKISDYQRVEPRISLRYLLNDNSSVKLAYTQNYQYIHIAPVSTVSLPTDMWMPSTSKIKPQLGIQYSAGYYKNFLNNDYELSLETYYKSYKNLIEFKKSVFINTGSTIDDHLYFGNGLAYGMEIMIKKRQGKSTGWIGYTLSKTTRQFDEINNGDPFYAKYDRRHDLSVVNSYKLNDKWDLSAVFVFATGNALTLPTSRYLIQGFVINKYSGINTFRMPPYHRLDVSLTYHKKLKKYDSTWSLSIYNLYNRKNTYYIYFEVLGSAEEKYLSVSPEFVSLFPVLPSISWNIKF